jgi:hypothetical protein
MKKIILASVSLVIALTACGQLREVANTAFKRGETLTYKAYYESLLTGKVAAGDVVFEIRKEDKKINDRSTLHIAALGRTRGIFNLFFKVVDRYETFIDEKAIVPWLFIRRVNEGGYIIEQDVTFNQNRNVAYFKDLKRNRTATVETPDYVQDILSAIYYCRTIDFSELKINETFRVNFLLDDTVFNTEVLYLGKETLKVGIGTVNCIKLKPQVLTGTVFKDPYPVLVYVSDDKNKIPVLAESEILVGKVKLELMKYSGLRNPFHALK